MKEKAMAIKTLRITGLCEGISFLVLLGIGMPAKYLLDLPMIMKVIGWAHGILFILFGIFVIQVKLKMNWTFLWMCVAMLASLLPFGTFFLDKQLKKEEKKLIDVPSLYDHFVTQD